MFNSTINGKFIPIFLSQKIRLIHRAALHQDNRHRRVVVTGLGLLSPLGIGHVDSWQNLIESKSGISSLEKNEQFSKLPCRIAGLIPDIEKCLEENFTKNQLRTYSRAGLYGLLAVREAIQNAKWTRPQNDLEASRCGVTIGSGMINFEDVIEAQRQFDRSYSRISPHFITKVLLNMPAGYVSMEYNLRGPNHTVSTACTTGAHAIGDALNFIRNDYADLMIAGSVEAPINPLSIASFCQIRALCANSNQSPESASRPFDRDRSGFVMSEGAAICVLEELNHAIQRGAPICGEILGYGLSADAHHITAPSEDGRGASESILSALRDANLTPEKIGHINCHATSTPLGDQIELDAIKKIFKTSSSLSITGTKGSHGHLLGAAGSAEFLFTLLTCLHGIIPPTLNLENPIDTEINIVAKRSQRWTESRRIALSNSFGFGGTNATLVVSNYIE
ncbi:3-oxoacyl-acyl-carrier-protein synthase [Sarcoptes scabiei]|nr:3-oxoacyl-acyl-carrier-protein synthase [Sarcoptes scabiei]